VSELLPLTQRLRGLAALPGPCQPLFFFLGLRPSTPFLPSNPPRPLAALAALPVRRRRRRRPSTPLPDADRLDRRPRRPDPRPTTRAAPAPASCLACLGPAGCFTSPRPPPRPKSISRIHEHPRRTYTPVRGPPQPAFAQPTFPASDSPKRRRLHAPRAPRTSRQHTRQYLSASTTHELSRGISAPRPSPLR
jgi:hypothetical protein